MEKTVELEVSKLLPGVENDKDECLNRLEASVQEHKGILRAHLKREKTPVNLCLHYDPDLLSLSDVRSIAIKSGNKINNRYHHDSIAVEGMDCSDCVVVLEHSLGRLDGVLSVKADYASEEMWVEYDTEKVERKEIEKRLTALGYRVPLSKRQAQFQENQEILFSLSSGLLLLIGWLGNFVPGFPKIAAVLLYLTSALFGGWFAAQNSWRTLRKGHFDTDLLMLVAAFGAVILGDLAEGALLLFLFSLGDALEERALEKAQNAIQSLADLAPKTALVKREGKEGEVPVDSLKLGDLVIAKPSVRIPADGIILKGESAVDQSTVTGEALPIEKAPGDSVYAGTINGESALEIKVTRLAKDSTLARIMKMVEEAQSQKSVTQQTVEKFERIFVPAVLLCTLAVIVIPPLFGFPFKASFLRAMTLLVAASPCALALGTPSAILSGIAQAGRNGVLVKGGVHLENLGRLQAIAFDKTGTITRGHPEVTDIVPFGIEETELLSLTAGAESRSNHPLAKAIVQKAQADRAPIASMDKVEALTGLGLRAEFTGRYLLIGSQAMMQTNSINITPEMERKANEFQSAGKMTMWVSMEKRVLGLIALADTLRPEAASAIKSLHKIGVKHTIMLTGDNSRSAAAIAGEAGISDFRADLMPEDKLCVLRELVGEYHQVAMIGDGVNDAPALANATVGIAMGGAGTDVALETADVVLMGDDLSKLPFAVGLGRATRSIVVQNLVIAVSVIGVLIITSLTGILGIGPAVVFHEGSTIVVVLNSLRLLKYE